MAGSPFDAKFPIKSVHAVKTVGVLVARRMNPELPLRNCAMAVDLLTAFFACAEERRDPNFGARSLGRKILRQVDGELGRVQLSEAEQRWGRNLKRDLKRKRSR